MGANSINPRHIIGAFIVKHKLGLTDEETLLTIRENPYMQFFLGLDHYQPDMLFSPSLFVEMRKRSGDQTFDEFSVAIMSIAHPSITQKKGEVGTKELSPRGKLKIDATVADHYITCPNDPGLVNDARLKTERMIDDLFELLRDQLKNQQPRSKLTRYEWAEKIILRGKPRGIKPHNMSKAKNLPQGGLYSLFRGSQEKTEVLDFYS